LIVTTVASASTNVITVVVKESGPRGLDGTAGTDGAGFNNVRRSLLDNPILWLYKKNRLANVLSGLITIDRPSDGTFVDFHDLVQTETADFPREGGDGWLIEDASINLPLHNKDFTNAAWIKEATSINSDVSTSPDNATTADRIVTNNGTALNVGQVRQVFTKAASAIQYTYSLFCKKDDYDRVQLSLQGSSSANGAELTYNFDTDLLSSSVFGNFTGASAKRRVIGNSYFRLELTFTSNTDTAVHIRVKNSDTVIINGDGVKGTIVWGAQLEILPFASSHIATTTTSVPRAAETHNFPVLNNVPFLRDGFSVLLRLDNYNEQTTGQDIFTIPDATSGTVFKINTTAGGKWEATIKGSDAIDYLATTTIDAVSDLDQFIVVTVSSIGVINIFVDGNVVNGTATVATGINGAVDVDGVVNVALGGDFIINMKGMRFYDFVLNTDEILYLND